MPLLQNYRPHIAPIVQFDYQSECHCSKTAKALDERDAGLTTSQNATAPKPEDAEFVGDRGLTTSQNATAPKPNGSSAGGRNGLTTSQNATAPKPTVNVMVVRFSLITSQNATAPKLVSVLSSSMPV